MYSFSIGLFYDKNLVAHAVSVWMSCSVFFLVILDNAFLLVILDVLPVRLERYIQNSVPLEHELCWGCVQGSVYSAVDCSAHRAEDSLPPEFIQIS